MVSIYFHDVDKIVLEVSTRYWSCDFIFMNIHGSMKNLDTVSLQNFQSEKIVS